MRVMITTDNKYLGMEIPNEITPGDSISLGDFSLEVQFVHRLENGNLCVGNSNYQLECEE